MITKEHFEAWLFAQPRDRSFDYTDSRGCLICSFLNETVKTDKHRWVVGPFNFGEAKTKAEPIPDWLLNLVYEIRHRPDYRRRRITIAAAQDTFVALFGNQTDALADSNAPLREQGEQRSSQS